MAFTLDEKVDIGSLLFEARLANEAAVMGLTTLGNDPALQQHGAKIETVRGFQAQSSDAVEALHKMLQSHISGSDNDNAPEVDE